MRPVICILLNPQDKIAAFAEACYRFTPQIALRPDEAVFLDMRASAHLFKEQVLPLRLRALAERFGLKARIGMADDAPSALALARLGGEDLKRLPLKALRDYASPFEYNSELDKKVGEMIEVLEALGLRSLRDFAALPLRGLPSRFGKLGLDLRRQVQGGDFTPWPRFTLPERIVETLDLCDAADMQGCGSLESILFSLKSCLDRAMARLHGRGERISVLEMEWTLERSVARQWRFEIPVPQGSASGLLTILRERVSWDLERSPLGGWVTGLRIHVLETVPGSSLQRDLFGRQAELEAWDTLLGRLCAKLGKSNAFFAVPVDRHLPEGSYLPQTPASHYRSETTGLPHHHTPSRPLRLLRRPEPVQRQGRWISHSTRSCRWRIRDWEGPERLSGEWWSDAGFERDYYRVIAETGEQLWVFSSGKCLFLHGYFD